MTYAEWLQTRLSRHGYTVKVDGLIGPATRAALKVFQTQRGLPPTGTDTVETVVSLRLEPSTGRDSKPPATIKVRPAWLAELERRLGLHEARDRSRLMEWLRSDGRTLGDPAKLPWCGDAIQTAIALTLPDEPQLANPYLARNWMGFGRAVEPCVGAIMVFWRGSPKGTQGHVALYDSEDETTYRVIGGNQQDAITYTRIAKGRLIGARWPRTSTIHTARHLQKALTGPLSTNEA